MLKVSGKILYQLSQFSSLAVLLPTGNISALQVLLIHETIFLHVSDENKAWWLEKASKEIADRQKASSATATTAKVANGETTAAMQRRGTGTADSVTVSAGDFVRDEDSVDKIGEVFSAKEACINGKIHVKRVLQFCRGQCRQRYCNSCMLLG